jgi:hypothetical protein
MPDNLPYYRPLFKREVLVPPMNVQPGGFYRLWSYTTVEGKSKNYGSTQAPILMVIGTVKSTGLIHAIRVSDLPINTFIKFFKRIMNREFIQESLNMEYQNTFLKRKDLHYRNNGNAYVVDEPFGRSFYQRMIGSNNLIMNYYETYRTYKIKNIKNMREVYFDWKKFVKTHPQLGKFIIPTKTTPPPPPPKKVIK